MKGLVSGVLLAVAIVGLLVSSLNPLVLPIVASTMFIGFLGYKTRMGPKILDIMTKKNQDKRCEPLEMGGLQERVQSSKSFLQRSCRVAFRRWMPKDEKEKNDSDHRPPKK